eukprot:305789-Pleurochrysis_carterae.AAC.1
MSISDAQIFRKYSIWHTMNEQQDDRLQDSLMCSANMLASERFCKSMLTASAAGASPPLPTTSMAMKAAASSTSRQAHGDSPLQPDQLFYCKLRTTFGTFIDKSMPAK